MIATATFTIESFQRADPYFSEGPVAFARASIRKRFTGEIEGTGAVEMMSANGSDGPAAYVALEHLAVALHGRVGSFALLHRGITTATGREGSWEIVPGTGQGDLIGIAGRGQITMAEDKTHTLVLEYEVV